MNEVAVFDLSAPAQALQVAEILQKFVKDKNLTATIQGKKYPLVEAWQFAGSQLGLYPHLIDITNLSDDHEIKYLARVEIRKIESGQCVGLGIALCSNKEASKKRFDEYAILSMAQTRATGKAFRNLLAWLMKAAGFEATPAEEMDFKITEPDLSDVPAESERQILRNLVYSSTLTEAEKQQTLQAIETLKTYDKYQYIQNHLEAKQPGIDLIQNPSHKDINKHLRGKMKNEDLIYESNNNEYAENK